MTISTRHFTTKARAWLLVAALTALLIGVDALVGGMFLYAFVALAVGVNVVGYWFSDRIAHVLQHLAVPSHVEDGVLFGPYYEGNEGTAIYNSSFRPFQSPVPFLFVRHGVTGDWKFFLDDEEWLNLWARRYGESGVHALAEELRGLPWRAGTRGS
jgi:hypothetical protein